MMMFQNFGKLFFGPQAPVCLWILGLLLNPTTGFAQDDHDHDHDQKKSAESQDHQEVILTREEQEEFQILTSIAGPGEISLTIHFPAEIHANDDNLAHIVPRYEGIVTDVFVHVGDQVEIGQTLANIEGDASLSIYPLKTRIEGTVISKHITRGEAASRDRAPFVIADLSTVWLDIHIFQRDLFRIREGQRITVTAGPGTPPIHGVISYMSPVVDETTRTAVARAVLDNGGRFWRPGMFVTTAVEVGFREAAVVVPVSALSTIHGTTSVFIARDDAFELREVETGAQNGSVVEILAGLEAGEIIVVEGGLTLKSELEKSTFGDGHNH